MAEVTAIARAPGEPLDPRRWAALAILLVGAFLARSISSSSMSRCPRWLRA